MLDSILFVVLPYAALALCCGVVPYRFFSNRLGWSTYSSQFLERERLFWGSLSWHYGILPILVAHLAGFLAPGAVQRLLGRPGALLAVETVGLGLALFALCGTLVLLWRRLVAARLLKVTFLADWLLLVLLLAQTAGGIHVALTMGSGALWYPHTATPYLRSLFAFQPQVAYLADFPLVFKLHVAGAFVLLGLIPFTKLVHFLYVPWRFLAEPPLLYRWHRLPGARRD